jgi:hypothetical protein
VRPLGGDLGVHDADSLIVAVVPPGELRRKLGERVAGERLAPLRPLVDGELEFGELGLTEDRAADAVQVVAEQRQTGTGIRHRLQHVVEEQRFVQRGRNLRHEDGVVRVGEVLGSVGVPAVHRVPQLVRQGADVVVLPVVVQQHVGVDVVHGAVGVGARPLPLAGVDVQPPAGEASPGGLHVVGAERPQGVERERHRLLDPVPEVHLPHQGGVQVVVVQLADLQDLPAEGKVTVERAEVGVDVLHEPAVDRLGDVPPVQRAVEAGAVTPAPRIEHVLPDFSVELGPVGAAERVEGAEVRREHLLAVLAADGGPLEVERGLVQPHAAASLEFHRGEREIGVRKDTVDRRRTVRHQGRIGQDGLLGLRERVFLAAEGVREVVAVYTEPLLGLHELVETGGVEPGDDIRLDERRERRKFRSKLRDLLLHPHAMTVAGVLVGPHAGVRGEAGVLLRKIGDELETPQEVGGGPGDGAAAGRDLLHAEGEPLLRGLPRGVGGIDRGQIPPVALGDLPAVAFDAGRSVRLHGGKEECMHQSGPWCVWSDSSGSG